MVVNWQSSATGVELDLLSGHPLVIRQLEWYSNGSLVVHWQSSGTGLELDWLSGYPLVIM